MIKSFVRELTYNFGGCTVVHGIDGSYQSQTGAVMQDEIVLVYSDVTLTFSAQFETLSRYMAELRDAAFQTLQEEAVLVAAYKVHHAI